MCSNFRFALFFDRIILRKLQADTVDAVPLIRRRIIPFSFEHMTKVATTVAANDFRSLHTEHIVCMSCNCARNRVEVCGPAAAGFEFVVGFVKGYVTAGASVDTRVG